MNGAAVTLSNCEGKNDTNTEHERPLYALVLYGYACDYKNFVTEISPYAAKLVIDDAVTHWYKIVYLGG